MLVSEAGDVFVAALESMAGDVDRVWVFLRVRLSSVLHEPQMIPAGQWQDAVRSLKRGVTWPQG